MSKKSDFFPVFLLLFASFCFFWFDCSCRLCFTHQSVRIAKRTTKLHHSCVCVVFLRVQRHKKGQRVKREMRFFSFQKCRERETCAHTQKNATKKARKIIHIGEIVHISTSPHRISLSLSLSLSLSVLLSLRARASVVSSSLLIHA